MITNRENFRGSLLHRLGQCLHLAKDAQTLHYLPEMLIRTLRDAHRLIHQKEPQNNAPALCLGLGIELTPEQGAMLLDWEDALRGEEKYANLSVDKESALALTLLLEKLLTGAAA